VPGVMKAIGLEKESATAKARRKAMKTGKVKAATTAELEKQVKILEAAALKIEGAKKATATERQEAAHQIITSATRIRGNMEGLKDNPATFPQVVGKYRDWAARLHNVKAKAQQVADTSMVATTKQQAEDVYFEAGRQGSATLRPGGAAPGAFKDGVPTRGGLAHLTGAARGNAFGRADVGQELPGFRARRELGRQLGLSAAQVAAINTFTNEDYKYINPGVVNSDAFMRKQNPAPDFVDKPDRTPEEEAELQKSLAATGMTMAQRQKERASELNTKKQEGALHEAIALEGLLKLPVWPGKGKKGLVYRGEVLNETDFRKRFSVGAGGKIRARKAADVLPNIQSQSRSEHQGKAIWSNAMQRVKPPHVFLIYETELTNGRNIEMFSSANHEQEVATLPGAEFEIVSAQWEPPVTDTSPYQKVVRIKRRQHK